MTIDNTRPLEPEKRPVVLTLAELWLLHDFVRHEILECRLWRFPPASEDLNEEIAFAIDSCHTYDLDEYTLMLSKGDLLVIDYLVRRDYKTPEGASGKAVLLKTFRARKELSTNLQDHPGDDITYMEGRQHASADHDTGSQPV